MLIYPTGEAIAEVACLGSEGKVLGRAYLCIEFLTEEQHFGVESEKGVFKNGVAAVSDTIYASFGLQRGDRTLRKSEGDHYARMISCGVM